MSNGNKYVWADVSFDNYLKEEVKRLREKGFNSIGTAGVTKLLYDRVLAPNDISLVKLLNPEIKMRGKKWQKKPIF